MKSGLQLIAEERTRQVLIEDWTPEHDDKHTQNELARAAACYALAENNTDLPAAHLWPFEIHWWKPRGHLRNLVRAGALIAAEIDRLQRQQAGALSIPEDHFRACGFESEAEFHRLVANADIRSHSKLKAFKEWQENDGTKEGLLRLQPGAQQ